MHISVGQPYEASATRATTAQCTLPAEHKRIPTASVATVWQSALAVFVSRAPTILLITCVCIAGPAMLALLVCAALRLEFYGQVSGPLATWLGISTLQGGYINPVSALLFVQAVLGVVGLTFARGVIARLALNDAVDTPSLSRACREAKARFPSLLVGSLLYGACITAGAVGINAALRDTNFDLRHVGRRDVTAPAKALALRALDVFVPSPGSPFAEVVPLLRHSSFADTTRFANTARSGADNGY